MKRKIIGMISLTAVLFLAGCGEDNPFPDQPISVAQMMKGQKVVGWQNKEKDSDLDGVPDIKDKQKNTIMNAEVDKNGVAIDSDKDGVPNGIDECPNTPLYAKVDKRGCPIDSDNDGVSDYLDKCPNTPEGVEVDKYGCMFDDDEDGVPNEFDECPNTLKNAIVDAKGCAIDSDNDGVPNGIDKCPNTKEGMEVDDKGCPVDDDEDGVKNQMDKCPNTPKCIEVNFEGCPMLSIFRFNFEVDSAKIDKKYYPQIEELAKILQNNKKIEVKIEGFTDNTGSAKHNKELSLARAEAVKDVLVKKFKINPKRIEVVGYGEEYPIATNDTEEGRKLNRRVVVVDKSNYKEYIVK